TMVSSTSRVREGEPGGRPRLGRGAGASRGALVSSAGGRRLDVLTSTLLLSLPPFPPQREAVTRLAHQVTAEAAGSPAAPPSPSGWANAGSLLRRYRRGRAVA